MKPSHRFVGPQKASNWPSRWPGGVLLILPTHVPISFSFFFFFFNDTATTDIYTNLNTLSLHDALPISSHIQKSRMPSSACDWRSEEHPLNSSHIQKSRMLSSA